jgi:DNA-binding NtrC family response regulator
VKVYDVAVGKSSNRRWMRRRGRLALPPRSPANSAASTATGILSGALADRVERFERATITAELNRARCNMTEAARTLGLERSHLYKKCVRLGIDVKSMRRPEE